MRIVKNHWWAWLLFFVVAELYGVDCFKSATTDLARYNPGDSVRFSVQLSAIPNDGYLQVFYRHLNVMIDSAIVPVTALNPEFQWQPPATDFQGYLAELCLIESDSILDRISLGIDVSSDWRKFPRYGFLSEYGSMSEEQRETVIDRLAEYHINGLQFYDWHWKHHRPLCGTTTEPASSWNDIANRQIYRATVEGYIELAHARNMQAMAYNLIYGAYEDAVSEGVQPEWRLFTDNAHQNPDKHDLPSSWASDIYLMDPSNAIWQNYINNEMRKTFEAFDFDGWHMDQLGDRGTLNNYSGETVVPKNSFQAFIEKSKTALDKSLVMNAVDQYGQSQIATTPVDFLYTEVWSETTYGGLASVIRANESYSNDTLPSVLAAYVNRNYSGISTEVNLPAVLLADAVIFANAGSHLELGEHYLTSEYFPSAQLAISDTLASRLQNYYDFLVAYENLLRDSIQGIIYSIVSQGSVTISKSATQNRIWAFARRSRSSAPGPDGPVNREIYHLINFYGVTTMDWRDQSESQIAPTQITNLPLIIKTDSTITNVWYASPDQNCGLPVKLDFAQHGDSLLLTLPELDYWAMVVLESKGTASSIRSEPTALPQELRLGHCCPNPFNPTTVIPFTLKSAASLTLTVINLKGEVVYQNRGRFQSGAHTLNFDGSKLSSGLYIVNLSVPGQTVSEKILLLK